ncbi:hypothetical protein SCHPADRAFT_907162 [Schizopora paradoxa]|uniref:Uncharacterized protein n=1 Tax=Schizopora paradoxa TaxID=27342 RepID=A0A0H2REA1_9AGAM|nr:hypothetical protein SCHPADRAFT_907162 [Schizopora paradoxa]
MRAGFTQISSIPHPFHILRLSQHLPTSSNPHQPKKGSTTSYSLNAQATASRNGHGTTRRSTARVDHNNVRIFECPTCTPTQEEAIARQFEQVYFHPGVSPSSILGPNLNLKPKPNLNLEPQS